MREKRAATKRPFAVSPEARRRRGPWLAKTWSVIITPGTPGGIAYQQFRAALRLPSDVTPTDTQRMAFELVYTTPKMIDFDVFCEALREGEGVVGAVAAGKAAKENQWSTK